MTVEHIDPPELAPPVLGIYHHVAIGRGSAVVAIAGQIALDPGVQALGLPEWLIEIDAFAVIS